MKSNVKLLALSFTILINKFKLRKIYIYLFNKFYVTLMAI